MTYNVNLLNAGIDECKSSGGGGAAFFYFERPVTLFPLNDNLNYTIGSRALVTNSLDLTNSTWFPIESSTLPTCKLLTSQIDTGDQENDTDNKATTNQESSLENMTLARIMADVDYDRVLELVCDYTLCICIQTSTCTHMKITNSSLLAKMLNFKITVSRFKTDPRCWH